MLLSGTCPQTIYNFREVLLLYVVQSMYRGHTRSGAKMQAKMQYNCCKSSSSRTGTPGDINAVLARSQTPQPPELHCRVLCLSLLCIGLMLFSILVSASKGRVMSLALLGLATVQGSVGMILHTMTSWWFSYVWNAAISSWSMCHCGLQPPGFAQRTEQLRPRVHDMSPT